MGKSWKCGSKRATRATYVASEPQASHKRATNSRKHLASLAATTLVNRLFHQVYKLGGQMGKSWKCEP